MFIPNVVLIAVVVFLAIWFFETRASQASVDKLKSELTSAIKGLKEKQEDLENEMSSLQSDVESAEAEVKNLKADVRVLRNDLDGRSRAGNSPYIIQP
jgi:peptidoglycan hydrolase CwlO-like protein